MTWAKKDTPRWNSLCLKNVKFEQNIENPPVLVCACWFINHLQSPWSLCSVLHSTSPKKPGPRMQMGLRFRIYTWKNRSELFSVNCPSFSLSEPHSSLKKKKNNSSLCYDQKSGELLRSVKVRWKMMFFSFYCFQQGNLTWKWELD